MSIDLVRRLARGMTDRVNRTSFHREYVLARDKRTQSDYLKVLLLHASRCIPYYRKVLRDVGVVVEGRLDRSRFEQIPVMTKETMAQHWDELVSEDYRTRKWYFNASGGSTGEPLRLIQDDQYARWGNAASYYWYKDILGIDEPAEKKVIVWGSERDLLEGRSGFKSRIANWLNNTVFLNAFSMTEDDMRRFVQTINTTRPGLVRGYAGSLYELCRFAGRNNLKMHSPKAVVSSAELLTSEMRTTIEAVFSSKVFNFYGSREANNIAGECRSGLMHIFSFHNFVEVLNGQGQPAQDGEEGRVVVTNLHNLSMPLIRYQIGDTAVFASHPCSCGSALPVLERLSGRITDSFAKADGTVVHGEFFTHLFYFKDWVRAFQVIQETYKSIRIVVHPRGVINEVEKGEIDRDIRIVMGEDTRIEWEFRYGVADTQSGKHVYTKSLVRR